MKGFAFGVAGFELLNLLQSQSLSSIVSSTVSSGAESGKEEKTGNRNFTAMRHWAYCRLYIRIKPRLLFVAVPSSHVHHAEVAIVMVVHGFPPNHRYSKSHCFDLSLGPKAKCSVQFLHTLWGAQDLS